MWNENNIRILVGVFGFCASIFGPWWLTLVPIMLLALRFTAGEALALGLWMDFLWLPHTGMPLYFLATLFIMWAFAPIRNELLLR